MYKKTIVFVMTAKTMMMTPYIYYNILILDLCLFKPFCVEIRQLKRANKTELYDHDVYVYLQN